MEQKKVFTIKALINLFLPVLIASIVGLFLYLIKNYTLLALLIAYGLPPGIFLGRLVVIPFVIRLDPLSMIAALTFVDIICTWMLAWSFDIITLLPIVGKLALKAELKGHNYIEKYKWVKGLASAGVVLFVAIPFYGTNAIVGTIVGRIIGLKPLNTVIAVSIGAFIGALIAVLPLYGMWIVMS